MGTAQQRARTLLIGADRGLLGRRFRCRRTAVSSAVAASTVVPIAPMLLVNDVPASAMDDAVAKPPADPPRRRHGLSRQQICR
jgi:hypothetical protein